MPHDERSARRRGLSRREFLAAAGAGATLYALGCEKPPPPPPLTGAPAGPRTLRPPNVMAGLPTTDGVTLNVVSPYSGPCIVELGREINTLAPVEELGVLQAGQPHRVTLRGLDPLTRYIYRVSPAEPGTGIMPAPGAFTTAHIGRDVFAFAVTADSFLLRDTPPSEAHPVGRVTNLLTAHEPDFHVSLGNEAVTHAPRRADYVQSQADADAVYHNLRKHYAPSLRITPLALVLGNHEGEGWIDAGRGHSQQLATWSRSARTRFLVNPTAATSPLGGSPHGNYFAWEWGAALFVALDPFTYSTTNPQQPEDWTLGAEQLAWLENVLATSTQRWKFVLLHHLVGGATWGGSDPLMGSPLRNYGRGGATFAHVGEQQRIHELLRKHGGNFVLKGHDRVYAHEIRDDIHYITCGHLTENDEEGPPSAARSEFAELYPDGFDTRPGHVRFEVGGSGVRVEFISLKREYIDTFEVR